MVSYSGFNEPPNFLIINSSSYLTQKSIDQLSALNARYLANLE